MASADQRVADAGRKFLKLAANRLTGDWVILGGNIDIAGPKEASNCQSMILLDIATEPGLPVEVIRPHG